MSAFTNNSEKEFDSCANRKPMNIINLPVMIT